MKYLLTLVLLLLCVPVWSRNFGNPVVEGDDLPFNSTLEPNALLYNTFTAGANDTIKAIYIRQAAGSGSDDSLKVAIYSFVSGEPENRETAVFEMGVPSSNFPTYAWDSVVVNYACEEDTTYCIGFGECRGSGTIQTFVAYDLAASSGDGTKKNFGSVMPTVWALTTNNTFRYSVYATLNTIPSDIVNERHNPDGEARRHDPEGESVRHGP